MAAAKSYEAGTSVVELARRFHVDQGMLGLAQMTLKHCPELAPLIESGEKSLLDVYELAERRRKASFVSSVKPIPSSRVQAINSGIRRANWDWLNHYLI
jgi:hypothetical protein